MKQAKPILHGRDHGPGGSDGIPSTGVTDGSPLVADATSGYLKWGTASTGAGLAAFTNTCGTTAIDDNPVLLNTATMHFSTTDGATFDSSGGLARILVPGLYYIGLQINVRNTATLTGGDERLELQLKYGGDIGYGIEVPWLGFPGASPSTANEEILGTAYLYADGDPSGKDIGLLRRHPISLTSSTTFPLTVEPYIYSTNVTQFNATYMGLWGFRICDALDSWHSD